MNEQYISTLPTIDVNRILFKLTLTSSLALFLGGGGSTFKELLRPLYRILRLR